MFFSVEMNEGKQKLRSFLISNLGNQFKEKHALNCYSFIDEGASAADITNALRMFRHFDWSNEQDAWMKVYSMLLKGN